MDRLLCSFMLGAALLLAGVAPVFGLAGDLPPGENFSHPDSWPPALLAMAKLPARVAGCFVNQDDYLAFRGDAAGFRACVETCLAIKEFGPTTLHLHQGAGHFLPLDRTKPPIGCDWQLDVINQRWRGQQPTPAGPAYSLELHLWLGGAIDLSALHLPASLKTVHD